MQNVFPILGIHKPWKGTVYLFFNKEPPQWVKNELNKIEIPNGGEISTKEYLGV